MARFEGDRVVLLRDVPWPEFMRRLRAKGESSVPRMHYLDGVLELMTPSRGHERQGSWLGALVGIYALEMNIELSAYGSWTLKDRLRRAGAEPDDCFILGDDSGNELPRPHLAIEINWSRRGIDKLEIYRRLGVPEVWMWEQGTLAIYVLRSRKYVQVRRSQALPDLDLDFLCSFLDRPTMTTAMREFRDAIQRQRGN